MLVGRQVLLVQWRERCTKKGGSLRQLSSLSLSLALLLLFVLVDSGPLRRITIAIAIAMITTLPAKILLLIRDQLDEQQDALNFAACCRSLYTLIVPSVYASPRLCDLCNSISEGLSRLTHDLMDLSLWFDTASPFFVRGR